MGNVELKRLFSEWRIKMQRVQQVLQQPGWEYAQWNEFAKMLAIVVRKNGTFWERDGSFFWDIRWKLQEGGELICQLEEVPEQKCSLTVAQKGGFANGVEEYIWLYCEFGRSGEFLGDPFWVDGNWRDALSMLIMPHQMAGSFYLGDGSVPIQNNLLGGGDQESWTAPQLAYARSAA